MNTTSFVLYRHIFLNDVAIIQSVVWGVQPPQCRVSYGYHSRLVYNQSMTIDRLPIVTTIRKPLFLYL